MPYICQNVGVCWSKSRRNIRVNSITKRIRDQKLKDGERWEYKRSMYGNVYSIFDHERMIWYRQDHPVTIVGDLFDGHLPF